MEPKASGRLCDLEGENSGTHPSHLEGITRVSSAPQWLEQTRNCFCATRTGALQDSCRSCRERTRHGQTRSGPSCRMGALPSELGGVQPQQRCFECHTRQILSQSRGGRDLSDHSRGRSGPRRVQSTAGSSAIHTTMRRDPRMHEAGQRLV